MNATKARDVRSRGLRIPLGLLLAFTLLSSALGPTVPVRAQDTQDDPNAPAPTRIVRDHRGENGPPLRVPPTPDPNAPPPIIRDHRDPYARVFLSINVVKIHNDLDWGDGEFGLRMRVHVLDDACADRLWRTCGADLIKAGLPTFSGSAGKVKQFNRIVPADGDTIIDRAISPTIGIPIREGVRYALTIEGTEWDPAEDDSLGGFTVPLTDEAGQVRFGLHLQRAFGGCVNDALPGTTFCPPRGDKDDPRGGFEVEYEIRRARVPDLRIGGLQVLDVPGSATKRVCPGVVNSELSDAGPFEVVLRVDGGPAVAKAAEGGLAGGSGGQLCFEAVLPAGPHELTVVVDEADAVLEFNERNNTYSQTHVVAAAAAEPAPAPNASPTPGPILIQGPSQDKERDQGQADLTVSAIRVNGRVPDGKDDCKDGKNDIAVVVKNTGTTKVDGFAVRLDVDGDEASAESEDGLEAGKERRSASTTSG